MSEARLIPFDLSKKKDRLELIGRSIRANKGSTSMVIQTICMESVGSTPHGKKKVRWYVDNFTDRDPVSGFHGRLDSLDLFLNWHFADTKEKKPVGKEDWF